MPKFRVREGFTYPYTAPIEDPQTGKTVMRNLRLNPGETINLDETDQYPHQLEPIQAETQQAAQ